MNLRVAVHELAPRLDGLELLAPEEDLPFHTAFNRSPLARPPRLHAGAPPRAGGRSGYTISMARRETHG